jgi:hypothetical protein
MSGARQIVVGPDDQNRERTLARIGLAASTETAEPDR